MNGTRRLFASAIGRRLLALFVVAAFVPVVTMMVIAVTRVSTAAEAALEEDLGRDAKSYGMQLIDRLGHLQLRLDEAVAPGVPRAVSEAAQQDLDAVALLDERGAIDLKFGRLPPGFTLAPFDATLARGKPIITRVDGADGTLFVLHRITGADGAKRTVVGALNKGALWGDADSYPALTDFCVATATGEVLNCSRPVAARFDWATLTHGGTKSLRWQEGDEPMRARAWTLFIESRFADVDWIVLAMRPENDALQAARSFRSAFLQVALLALLIVLLVSSSQIRRILVPLQQVLRGTVTVAGSNFDTRIEVSSRDEFGQLADAFNDMSARLGLQFRTFAAFAEIDRTILTTLDIDHVAATAIKLIRELAGVDAVSLALAEPGSEGRVRVHGLAAREGERAASVEFEWNVATLATVEPLSWTDAPPLPAGYLDELRRTGARQFALLPFRRGPFAAGAVVLGHATAKEVPSERSGRLADAVDRLAIALAAVARDKELHEQTHFDTLTGLPNRYYLLSLLTQSLARAQRRNGTAAALLVDLDHFKRINDTLGHAAGDRLLQAAAARIRNAVREDDVVARLGGDEFIVVLDQPGDAAGIGATAQELIDVLSVPFDADGQAMYLGASIGIAIYPHDAPTADELLKQSDTAMYRAKSLGRCRFKFFEDRMNTEASERARIDRELHLALQRDELVLHYQPLLDLRSGNLHGAEALVRWQHPERGLLGPGAFIAVAEESGLIEALGAWVLERACDQFARWRREGLDIGHVSVNVSSRQLQRKDFFDRAVAALERNRMPATALWLEVTESLFTDAGAVALLGRLRALGVGIAVDDFGTGYSSFAYLRTLPISVVKIDRTFVVDVATNTAAATITAAIINMAQALGKEVVAEGVETEAQVAFLKKAGCEVVQGFVVSRPVGADAYAALLRRHRAARPLAHSGDDHIEHEATAA